jgi:hypothetical protein
MPFTSIADSSGRIVMLKVPLPVAQPKRPRSKSFAHTHNPAAFVGFLAAILHLRRTPISGALQLLRNLPH